MWMDTSYENGTDYVYEINSQGDKQIKFITNPGPRRGHSMVLYDKKVILFGGRANDVLKSHIPKSFKIVEGIVWDCKPPLSMTHCLHPSPS